MTAATRDALAFDVVGDGPPVVLLHGLTFDKQTWDPVVEHLAPTCRCICVDLPGHGGSGGVAAPLEKIAYALADVVASAAKRPPVVVGHSFGAIVALRYAARQRVRAVVDVDQPLTAGPFIKLLQSTMPALHADFDAAFARFTDSMGFDELPAAAALLAKARHRPEREVVIGYWTDLLHKGPEGTQMEVDADIASVASAGVPFVVVTCHCLDDAQRRVLAPLGAALRVEEWRGTGHFPHLAHPERFARLVASLATGEAPEAVPVEVL